MGQPKVSFVQCEQATVWPEISKTHDWIDSSFSTSPSAIGELRFSPPANGNYARKHPVCDPSGATVGYIAKGVWEIGYTYTSVYVGGCFWIANAPIRGTTSSNDFSRVSLVDRVGQFFWGKDPKFAVTKTFVLGDGWPFSIEAFKLVGDGSHLFYMSKCGFALFDVRGREREAQVDFDDLAYQFSGFDVSPKVLSLAVAFSTRDCRDVVDGEYRYKNFLRLYDMTTGFVLGQQDLPGSSHEHWVVNFSENGRRLKVESKSKIIIFEMKSI